MKIKINIWMLLSIIFGTVLYVILRKMIGTIPECHTEVYKITDVLKAGVFFTTIWVLGFWSKWYKH